MVIPHVHVHVVYEACRHFNLGLAHHWTTRFEAKHRIWQMSWETIQMLCGINFSTVIYLLIMKPYQGKRTKLVQVMYMDVVMMYTCTYLLLHVRALVIPPYGAYMHVAHSLTEI